MCVTLAVHMPQTSLCHITNGYRSADRPYATQVEAFCKQHRLPYSNVFVSICVYPKTDDPQSLAGVYGPCTVILKNRCIVPDVQIASSDDFQDLTYNGYKKELAGLRIRKYLDQIYDLSGLADDKRVEALLAVARETTNSKYAEARIFRPLVVDDVDKVLDACKREIPKDSWIQPEKPAKHPMQPTTASAETGNCKGRL